MSDAVKYAPYAHRKELTFRQAEKIDPLPKMLALGELDQRLRRKFWDTIYIFVHLFEDDSNYSLYGPGRDIAIDVASNALNLPLDDALTLADNFRSFYRHTKPIILNGSYADCLEVVQTILRSDCPSPVKGHLIKILDDPACPYIAVDFPPLTIIPRGNEVEQKAFETNWSAIKASTFEDAKSHLRQSAEALNAGDSAGAIREAIHAVESAAKIITGKDNATLGCALKILKSEKGLNGVLNDAFNKLYGYTSSEHGIRHALTDADNANIGQDEALFMFSACTAFVGYLARKFPEKV